MESCSRSPRRTSRREISAGVSQRGNTRGGCGWLCVVLTGESFWSPKVRSAARRRRELWGGFTRARARACVRAQVMVCTVDAPARG